MHYTPFQLCLLSLFGELEVDRFGRLEKSVALERLIKLTGKDLGENPLHWVEWAKESAQFRAQVTGEYWQKLAKFHGKKE